MGSYTPDHAGIARYLNEDPDLRECLAGRAQVGLQVATGLAPRSTGRFARSGKVVYNGPRSGGDLMDRMSYSIVWDDPAAVSIIFGTRDTPAHMGMIDAALRVMGDPHHNPGA